MLVEVEPESVAKSDLEEIVIETLLGNANLLGSLLKGVLFGLSGLVGRSRVVLPPLDDLLDNVADPPLFGASALLLALSRHLRLVILAGLLPLVLNVADGVLRVHQSVDVQQPEVLGLDVQKGVQADLLEVDGDILADGEYSTGNEDLALWQIVGDFLVCIVQALLSSGML